MARATTQSDDFSLISGFLNGYRNREDNTVPPPGTMIEGSQNVLTNSAMRLGPRKGYTLDGTASGVVAPILSAFDWPRHTGDTRHLRAGFLTSAANDGKLQYRYEDPTTGVVTWRDLMTSLTSVSFNFTDWWDFGTEYKSFLLFVDGSSNIYEWSGGITTVSAVTANTITITGTKTWAELGFYNVGATNKVTINGTDYTYTGGGGTLTLTGVTPDPAAGGVVNGDIAHQTVKTTANGSMTGIPSTFYNNNVAVFGGQLYVSASDSNSIYVSKVNNYKDYGYTAIRLVGEGAVLNLDGVPTAMIPQEDNMVFSAGKDWWYQTKFTLSSDLAKEDLTIIPLKTTNQQAAQSQALTTKIKNDVAFISFEPILNTLGRVQNVVLTQQVSDISYPIINLFNTYDFTDASIKFWKNYLLVAVPKEQLTLIYNMTRPDVRYWEAPQTIPASRFSIIDGEIYFHSYLTSDSFKLFDGYNDNGGDMTAIAKFGNGSYGTRSKRKTTSEAFVDGYIKANTKLQMSINFDLDGCKTAKKINLIGTQTRFVCSPSDTASLGIESLGKQPLGSEILPTVSVPIPPYFHWIKTFDSTNFFFDQFVFSSSGVDQQWEILSFGAKVEMSEDVNSDIKD